MYNPTKRDKLFKDIWVCAYRRAYEHRKTTRWHREWETVQMCLNTAKWQIFENDRRSLLTPSQAVVATDDDLWYDIMSYP
jgi:hypothetical protein